MRESLLLILVIVVLWALSGAAFAWGLGALYGVEWVPPCATLNIALGLILLQFVTRHERGSRQVYARERQEDQLNLGAVLLIAFPALLTTFGLLWWLLSQVAPLP